MSLLASLYFKYKRYRKSIRRVRKSLKEKGDGGCCKYYLLCGLLETFLGHLVCCCHGCRVREKSKQSKNSNESIIQNRIDLVNNEANATTPTILGSMKKNYFNYRLITSTTATIMEVIVTLLNVGIIHIANGKVYSKTSVVSARTELHRTKQYHERKA